MKVLAIVAGTLFAVSSFASNPTISGTELNGTYKGVSANGPCTVKMERMGDVLVLKVDQNMTKIRSLPVSVSAVLQKISGNQCGGVTVNNQCGEYTLKDSMNGGAGYNNEVTLTASIMKDQRCLKVEVTDTSFGEWIGSNYCSINFNHSGAGCGDEGDFGL